MANNQPVHKVLIENAVFHSYHGVHDEESIIGGKFEVSLEIITNFSLAAKTDELKGTVDYASVYGIIEKEVEKPSKLIEHLGQRIIDRIRSDYDHIEQIQIKISKLNPPISGEISKVSIVIQD